MATLVSEKTIAVAEAGGVFDVYNTHRDAILASLESIVFVGVTPPENVSLTLPSPTRVVRTVTQAAARPASARSGCFLAGTPVHTQDGLLPIEAVWPGTELDAVNPAPSGAAAPGPAAVTREPLLRTVALPYEGEITAISTVDETIRATGHHPFLVADGPELNLRKLPDELDAAEALAPSGARWVAARDLRAGDILVTAGGVAAVASVSTQIATTTVYHLSLSEPHTFAVGRAGVVVHNAGQAESAPAEAYKAPVESEQATRERQVIGGGAIAASLPRDAENERIRVYSGACSLYIDHIEETKRSIAEMAEEAEGYVEQSSDTRIVIRVPAARFRDVFDRITGSGEVLYKAVETYDVTDQFTDPSGRLAVAIRARDRLYVLLERVEDPKERLAILKQIRDYTETIERLQLSLEVLEQRIAMSRITVELYSRLAQVATADRPIPFAWLERLRPLYESTAPLEKNAAFTFPADIAVFELEDTLRAEAADGTRIRAGTVPNIPRGDTVFWQHTMAYHLGPRYSNAESVDLESFSLVLFTSKDRAPYYFLVGTLPLEEEDSLVVVEVFFPHAEALERHYDNLLDSFREVET